MSADKLFSTVTIQYTIMDPKDPTMVMDRTITDVIDINTCIHQTAKSARLLGMVVNSFTVLVTMANG